MKTNDDKELMADLYNRYGPLVGGAQLAKSLGFSSTVAFRQALRRGTIPIEVFELPNRKGKFALTRDLIIWLSRVKPSAQDSDSPAL